NRIALEGSSVFGFSVTEKAWGVRIPVKLTTRLHPLARIPANSRVPADLGPIVPFSRVAAHRLHFATHSLAAECLTDKHQQQGSKHGVHECSFRAFAGLQRLDYPSYSGPPEPKATLHITPGLTAALSTPGVRIIVTVVEPECFGC